MRFYVNASNLLSFIARLGTSTNTTEEFNGYLDYTVNDYRCNTSNFPGVVFSINLSISETYKDYFFYRMLCGKDLERAKLGKFGKMLVMKKEDNRSTVPSHVKRI